MSRTHPTAAALLLGFSIFAIASAPITAGARHSQQGTFDVALFSDDDHDEQIIVIRLDRDTATGVEGMDDDARLLQGRDVERASRRIRRLADDNGVNLVDIDSEGSEQVTIVAEDTGDGGGTAYISIGEHGIEIHADGDGEDSVHISFGNPSRNARNAENGAVRIHARGEDEGDRTVVLLSNLDADATREFIDDLDDVPRTLKREMLRELNL
ncbi:MAG: hypothetical protein AAGA68_01715 [Pseudomonadota bacterium]